jgi:hypothetical protein
MRRGRAKTIRPRADFVRRGTARRGAPTAESRRAIRSDPRMSFVLRFFHAPHVATVREAVAWADAQPGRGHGPNPHFADFVQRISEFYPDLSSDDDDEADRNLWPEGLDSDENDGPVVNVLINSDMLEPGVMAAIATHADAAGLRVLDEQNGLLFGPGPKCVGLGDTEATPLPEISDRARSLMTENVRGLRFDLSQRSIADALKRALGKGFTRAEGRSTSVVRRAHSDLRQIVTVQVMRSTDRHNARAYCRLGFSCESLANTWMPLLPATFVKRRANYDASAGGTELEFRWFLPELASGDLPAMLSLATDSRLRFADEAELKRIVADLKPWSTGTLRPFLDGVGTIDDLMPLCLTDAALQYARVGPMAFPVYPAMLTLARRAGRDALDAYAAAYRANRELPRLCSLFKDPAGEHFDRLVEGLRALDRV